MKVPCSSRKWASLLGMQDIEILNILSRICKTIGTEEAEQMPIAVQTGSEQCYTNTRTDTGEPRRNCTNVKSKSGVLYKHRQSFKFK